MSEKYRTVEHEKPFEYDEGDYHVTRGCAWTGPGCHLGCGVIMYTDQEGNFFKCEGDPEDPWTEGRLCMRCLDAPEVTNHKERLLYPMKRAREDVRRAQRHRLRVRGAARFHHQQGDLCGRDEIRHGDQPGARSPLEPRGLAVGQRG